MKHYYDTVFQTAAGGTVLPAVGATVNVYLQGTLNAATIYSDDGVTPKTNPLTTDASGKFDFYVADGRYDLQFSGAGLTTFTQRDITLQDFASHGIIVPTGTINGSNAVFTIPKISGGVQLVLRNGVTQNPGAGNDYTISGTTLTFATAPLTGDNLLIIY